MTATEACFSLYVRFCWWAWNGNDAVTRPLFKNRRRKLITNCRVLPDNHSAFYYCFLLKLNMQCIPQLEYSVSSTWCFQNEDLSHESILATLPPNPSQVTRKNLEEFSPSLVTPCCSQRVCLFLLWTLVIVCLQYFSEVYFRDIYLYFYTNAEVHYPFITTKQEEISYRDKITRGKKGNAIRIKI